MDFPLKDFLAFLPPELFALVYPVFVLTLIFLIWLSASIRGESSGAAKNRQGLLLFFENRNFTEAYFSILSGCNRALQQFYGRKFSWKALWICFGLAFAYPTLFYCVRYIAFGELYLGHLRLFEQDTYLFRSLVCLLLVFAFLSIRCLITREYAAIGFVSVVAAAAVGGGVSGGVGGVVVGLVVVVSLVVGVFVIGGGGRDVVVCAGVVLVVGGGGVVGNGIAFFIGGVSGSYDSSVLAWLLLSLFPIANAVHDFLSWFISRGMLEYLEQHHRHVFKNLFLILLDAILALVFLILMGLSLIWIFTVLGIAWYPIAHDVLTQPFSKGLPVFLMLTSTLIPTFLHFSLALFVFFIVVLFRNHNKYAAFLKKHAQVHPGTMAYDIFSLKVSLYYALSVLVLLWGGMQLAKLADDFGYFCDLLNFIEYTLGPFIDYQPFEERTNMCGVCYTTPS